MTNGPVDKFGETVKAAADKVEDLNTKFDSIINKPGVRDKIWQMSQKYGVSPNEIVYTIYKESAGVFNLTLPRPRR